MLTEQGCSWQFLSSTPRALTHQPLSSMCCRQHCTGVPNQSIVSMWENRMLHQDTLVLVSGHITRHVWVQGTAVGKADGKDKRFIQVTFTGWSPDQIGKSHSVISIYLNSSSVSVWVEMHVDVKVSTCTHRAKPASHLCNHLASTLLAPGSAVSETDDIPLMSSHDLSVKPILSFLMPAGNAKRGAAGPGAGAHPFPPTLLLQKGKWALLKPWFTPAPLISLFSGLAVFLLPV